MGFATTDPHSHKAQTKLYQIPKFGVNQESFDWVQPFEIYKEMYGHPDRLRHSIRRGANARNISFQIPLRWSIYTINSVDKTKLSCNTPTDAAPHFL